MIERILNSLGFVELLLIIITLNSCGCKEQLEQININLITLTETIQNVKGANK